jgi:hypothetical protein
MRGPVRPSRSALTQRGPVVTVCYARYWFHGGDMSEFYVDAMKGQS